MTILAKFKVVSVHVNGIMRAFSAENVPKDIMVSLNACLVIVICKALPRSNVTLRLVNVLVKTVLEKELVANVTSGFMAILIAIIVRAIEQEQQMKYAIKKMETVFANPVMEVWHAIDVLLDFLVIQTVQNVVAMLQDQLAKSVDLMAGANV